MTDSFGARSALAVGGKDYEIYRLDAVKEGHVDRLPYSLKILLENLLRTEDGKAVTKDDIEAMAEWLTALIDNDLDTWTDILEERGPAPDVD